MNKHTVHLFMGKDMASIAEAISNHVSNHGNLDTKDYVHILTVTKNDNIYKIKDVNIQNSLKEISDDIVGSHYFEELFSTTIAIGKGVDTLSSELYLCIHLQLFDKEQLANLKVLVSWIKASGAPYVVDVYGIAYDLASIFCITQDEKKQLIYKSEQNKVSTKEAIDCIVDELHLNGEVNRLLLIQNKNFKGIGLKLNKDTFIRILGEFALLTSEQYYELFPVSAVEDCEINAFGISALWFNKFFYKDYLLTRSLLSIFDREGFNKTQIDNPLDVLHKAQDFIKKYSSLLQDYYTKCILPGVKDRTITETNKEDFCYKFKEQIDTFSKELETLIGDNTLSLEEKRLLYALLLREDDEMMDDDFIIEQYPSLDECFKEAINLYIDENNRIIDEGENNILSGPLNSNHVYNPIDELSELKVAIRKSKSFIRKSEARLKEIQEGMAFDNDSRKVIVDGDYHFGGNTFRLLNDIVEEPLEETYVPKSNSAVSIDVRENFSPIRDQGGIGACSAFASSSMFEYILNCHDNCTSHRLSPRFLYYNVCDKNSDGTPIDNGSNYYRIMHSLGDLGICEEGLCPYAEDFSIPPSEEAIKEASSRLVTKAMNVNLVHKDVVSALAEGYPVGIALKLFNSFKPDQNGFIFRPTDDELNSEEFGWHAMVICGFSEKQKVYVVRNSWGVSWGDDGYCYIPFSYVEDPELCRQACIIAGVSCSQFGSQEISKDVEFDWDSKDVEYAALRILIEEEKVGLKKLEKSYSSLQEQYIKLLTELTHTGKRDQIREHATNKYVSSNSPEQTFDSSHNSGKMSLLPFAISGIGLLSSGTLYYTNTISDTTGIALGGASVIAGLLWYFLSKNKNTDSIEFKCNSIEEKSYFSLLDLEIKFRTAGILIDSLKDLRNQIEKSHRRITSYLLNLKQWNDQFKEKELSLTDELKDPFITILNESDFERIFEKYQKGYTCDISLWDKFAIYDIDTNKIRAFFENLINEISERITNSYMDFSMYDYITKSSYEPYSINEDTKLEYLKRIDYQSQPFAEHITGHPKKPSRRLLLVLCKEDEKQKRFEEFCKINFSTSPQSCFGGTSYKMTYVQVTGCQRNELKLYKE